jgi:hypothetical protein
MSMLGAGLEGVYAMTVKASFPIRMRRHLLCVVVRSTGRRADGDGASTWGIITDSVGGS